MNEEREKCLGEFAHIPIWIEHPESDSHFVGTREDLVDTCVEVGYAIYGTEEEYQRIKDFTYKTDMLQEIKGNILNAPEGIICHQVNCKGKMGAGLALAIRNKFPAVYTDYMNAFNGPTGLRLGDVIWTQVGERLWVASLCGQDGYGRDKSVVYTQYDAVEKCLQVVASTKMYPVLIPKGMGCTLANGDWDTMYALIHKVIPHALIVNHQNQTVIDSFAGSHHFLSNFSDSPIQMLLDESQQQQLGVNAIVFPTVEHYFQAMKSTHPTIWLAISQLKTPGAAKRAGRGKPMDVGNTKMVLTMRPDWDSVKLGYMEQALRAKFKHAHLRAKLLDTDGSELVEGNTWGDTFWGVCRGKGENHLGRLLMKIRGELKAGS